MKTFLVIVLGALFLASVLLDKTYRTLSAKELKRRARSGNSKETFAIYKAASYGESFKVFLGLVGGISAAVTFLIIADASRWLAILAILVAGWLVLTNKPLRVGGALWKIASVLAASSITLLNFLHPLLSRIVGWFKKLQPVQLHTGLYDKEDLLDLLENQNRQIDNRIPDEDLRIAIGALTFGDKTVGSVMTPRRELKLVAASEPIGPMLMDELHTSGFSRFPVVREPTRAANPEIIGTLYLKDLIGHQDKGRVRDVMKKDAHYINESQDLRSALDAFIKTQHHLLVVVNNFEEIAGVVTLEDTIEQILGKNIVDEFDHYDNLRAVAGLEARKEQVRHPAPEVVE